MPILAILQGAYTLLMLLTRNLPSIVSLANLGFEVLKRYEDARVEHGREEAQKQLLEGIKNAGITKDTSALEAIFNPSVANNESHPK